MSKKRKIFARFVVQARDDADVWALSHEAFRLWWSSVLWCRAKGNNGIVPDAVLRGLAPIKNPGKAAQELESAGFWIRDMDGWEIRSYSEYQDTASDIERRKLAAQIANAAQGKGTDPVTEPVTDLARNR